MFFSLLIALTADCLSESCPVPGFICASSPAENDFANPLSTNSRHSFIYTELCYQSSATKPHVLGYFSKSRRSANELKPGLHMRTPLTMGKL